MGAFAAACTAARGPGPATPRDLVPPPASGPAAVPLVVAAAGPAATWYEAAAPRRALPRVEDPLQRDLFALLAARADEAGAPPLVFDPHLQALADVLARQPMAVVNDFEIVRFLQSTVGDPLPDPVLFVARASSDIDANGLRKILPGPRDLLRPASLVRVAVGLHRTPNDVSVVIVLQEQGALIDRFPRRLPGSGAARLTGEVLGGRGGAKVVVTTPRGTVLPVALQTAGARFAAKVVCSEGAGRYAVELLAEADRGPEVLANFPIYCGVAPPRTATVAQVRRLEARDVNDVRRIEQQMFEVVNRDRAAAGLPALAWHGGLAAVGRRHSEEMAATGAVAHTSPVTGTAVDRVAGLGLRNLSLLAENVGVGGSVEELERGFLSSPGHRANVLHREVTHVGIGIAVGRGELGGLLLFVTQLFAKF